MLKLERNLSITVLCRALARKYMQMIEGHVHNIPVYIT